MTEPQGQEVRRLFLRGSAYTVSTAVQLSVNVLALPLITRLLSPGEYGRVATALVVVQILSFVASLGLPYAITLEYFSSRGGLVAARGLALVTAGIAVLVVIPVDLLGNVWANALFSNLDYEAALRLGVWAAVPSAVLMSGQALLRSRDLAGRFVAVTLTGTVGAQLLGLGAALARPTAAAYMTGVLVGLSIAAAGALVGGGLDRRRVFDAGLVGASLRLGLATVPHALAIYVISVGDRILVERELGVAAVARYQVAYLVGALGLTLAGAFNNAWGPIVYGATDDRRWPVLAETAAVLYRMAGWIAAALAIGGPLALAVVAPGSYQPLHLAPVTAVVAMSLLPYVAYLANGHPIFYERRAWQLAWITPTSAAVNVALNLVLLPRVGLVGASIATITAYAVQAALAHRIAGRIAVIPWEPGVAVRAWAVAGVGVAVGATLPTNAAGLAVRAVLTLACAAALAREARRSFRPVP